MKNLLLSVATLVLLTGVASAQAPDSLRAIDLSEVVVEGSRITRQLAVPDRQAGLQLTRRAGLGSPDTAPDAEGQFEQRAEQVVFHEATDVLPRTRPVALRRAFGQPDVGH